MIENRHVNGIIHCAIEVHRALGPGLLESAYEECLSYELGVADIAFVRQLPLPITYKGIRLDCGYKIDLLVENEIVVELKSIEHIKGIHEAQILTYMRPAHMKHGLLINFNVVLLKQGLKSFIL